SKAKTVKVNELPPHPLRDAVAVGDYRLDEKIASTDLQTGQSVSYEFRVFGEGNISSVEKPPLTKDNVFDFYEPNVRQNINRESNRVAGTKSFNYFMIPKEPGTFKLGDYFQWVFFNPTTKKYDTLRSQYTVQVKGESQKNQFIESTDLGSFYDRIDATDNTLRKAQNYDWMKVGFNIFIVVILAASTYLVFRK
ncbi:MAG TPA: BatD family protein, partial [Cyclobacteriaceae bacterium]|nr:BatD family protein [Cyclobacteriaceae bacterium]